MSRKKISISKNDYARIEEFASKGLSISLIADALGISKATLDRRISEDASLEGLINRGRAKGIETVASVSYQMAISGKCPAMTIFWLKCRAGWKEKSEDESEGVQQIDITFVRGNSKERIPD